MTHALCDRAAAYRFVELTPGTATHFASLTYPHYRRRLFEWTPDSRIVAIGIDQAEVPVALALACYACEQSRGGYGMRICFHCSWRPHIEVVAWERRSSPRRKRGSKPMAAPASSFDTWRTRALRRWNISCVGGNGRGPWKPRSSAMPAPPT